jgi:ketosteroid isomerase-like protein
VRTVTRMTPDTAEVIRRYNEAFEHHDPGPLAELVADDCVLENTSPAPDGARFEGREAVEAFWQQIAADTSMNFEIEDVIVMDDRAIIYWRLRYGAAHEESVRGVNLLLVRDGKIIEARGYVKSG